MRNLATTLAVLAAAGFAPDLRAQEQDAPVAQDEAPDPVAPGDITEWTRGLAYGRTDSSWDHQPQIERIVQLPAPRLVPIQKLPIDQGRRAKFQPRIKQYGGFDGISHTGWVPPDPTLAVGPNHVLETVNMQIAWWDKAGNLQLSIPLNDSGNPGFFETVGAGGFTFDPKCFYDNRAGRFVVVAFEVYGSTESWIDLAVSDDSDPNGTWYKYRTDAVTWNGSTSYWVDYPGFGFDDRAYYVTGNLFGLNTGGWGGVKYRIFDKIPLLAGNPATWFDLVDSGAASVQIAECHNNPRNPLFVSTESNTSIKLQAVKNILTNPSLTTTSITVPYYQGPPGAPELGGGSLDCLDGRMVNAEYSNGHVVFGHGIDTGNGKAVARWYEVKTNSWPAPGATPVLTQSGNVDLGPAVYTWYPGVARSSINEIGITMAYSSASEYAGVAVAVHKPSDPAGTVSLIERVRLGAGSASGRWGDYFDCTIDPSNAALFWGVGEYPNWGTNIVSFDSVPTVPTTGVLYSTRADGTVGSLAFAMGDIVHLDPVTGIHSLYFDCSDVLTGTRDIDAFCVQSDGSILISFSDDVFQIPGITGAPGGGTTIYDEDIVKFTPTRLGESTAGTWSFYFDGSDVALTASGEDLDALALDAAGNLLMSFGGTWDVGGGLTGLDEDVVKFTPTSLGKVTAGSFAWFLYGKDVDVKLNSLGENTDAIDYDLSTTTLTLSTVGDFLVPGNVTGQNRDLVTFTPTQYGFDPAGTWQFTLDGDAYGLDVEDIDGLEILP